MGVGFGLKTAVEALPGAGAMPDIQAAIDYAAQHGGCGKACQIANHAAAQGNQRIMSARLEQKQQTRRRIVDAAARAIRERGLAKPSVNEVMADAGDSAAQAMLGEILDRAEQDEEAVKYFRKSAELGNAGSFFKNPVVDAAHAAALLAQWPDLPHYPQADGRVKLAAGWLIDRAGFGARRRAARQRRRPGQDGLSGPRQPRPAGTAHLDHRLRRAAAGQ